MKSIFQNHGGKAVEVPRISGGAGSGWFAEGGHVAGGAKSDSEAHASTPHGTKVASHKRGSVEVKREGDRVRFGARTKGGQLIGTANTIKGALEHLDNHGKGTYDRWK